MKIVGLIIVSIILYIHLRSGELSDLLEHKKLKDYTVNDVLSLVVVLLLVFLFIQTLTEVI